MAKVETKSIDDILPDPNNANKHTQRGHQIVENSIRRRGVGRGILAAGKNTDKPVIMAGNLTAEKARDAGIDEVVIVHTTGNQLVVTVRDDLDPTSPEAIALGIEDNESGKQSYNPDIDLLAAMSAGDNGVLSALKRDDKIFGDMMERMQPYNFDPEKEWEGMPEFIPEAKAFRSLMIHFETEDKFIEFVKLTGQEINEKTKYIWYPKRERRRERRVFVDES